MSNTNWRKIVVYNPDNTVTVDMSTYDGSQATNKQYVDGNINNAIIMTVMGWLP